jgi:hypothetical protein
MVFIMTVLRCSHVQSAANTLLPIWCYADPCRPVATFTAFILHCCFDIQDHTTMLHRLRSYHAWSPLLLWFMQMICIIFVLHFSTNFEYEWTYWCESNSSRFTSARTFKCWLKFKLHRSLGAEAQKKAKKVLGMVSWWSVKYQRYKNKLLPDRS